MVTAWFYTGIVSVFSLGLAGVAVVGGAIAATWAAVGVYLGRLYDRDKRKTQTTTES